MYLFVAMVRIMCVENTESKKESGLQTVKIYFSLISPVMV